MNQLLLKDLVMIRDRARRQWRAGKGTFEAYQAAVKIWQRERDRLVNAGVIKGP